MALPEKYRFILNCLLFSVTCVCDLYPVQRHSWPAITFSTSPRLGLDSACEMTDVVADDSGHDYFMVVWTLLQH